MNFKFSRFEIDQNIMFVIQNFLGETTQEILASMHEIAVTATTNTLEKSRARRLSKKIQFFYKKSKVPILLTIESPYYDSHKSYHPDQALPVEVEIKFPKKIMKLDVKQLEEMASEKMEKTLGLRDNMTSLVNITQPEIKMPKVLKGVL